MNLGVVLMGDVSSNRSLPQRPQPQQEPSKLFTLNRVVHRNYNFCSNPSTLSNKLRRGGGGSDGSSPVPQLVSHRRLSTAGAASLGTPVVSSSGEDSSPSSFTTVMAGLVPMNPYNYVMALDTCPCRYLRQSYCCTQYQIHCAVCYTQDAL